MIPCCSHLLTPLTVLIKKNIKFKWAKEHQQAFNSLQNFLTCEVVLAYLDFSIPFKIYMPPNTKSDLSSPKRTSHMHCIQGNLLILKWDTPSQNSSCLQ
jgi:hypothetical protein